MGKKFRGSLGFRNINGKAIKLVVEKKVSNKLFTREANKNLQRWIVSAMNKAGRLARDKAKNKDWSPYLSGALISTIKWDKAKFTANRNAVRGDLVAGGKSTHVKTKPIVDYARVQELTNPNGKKFYLKRALTLIAQPEIKRLLTEKKIYEDILIGGSKFIVRGVKGTADG
jgi:hypothetical protein